MPNQLQRTSTFACSIIRRSLISAHTLSFSSRCTCSILLHIFACIMQGLVTTDHLVTAVCFLSFFFSLKIETQFDRCLSMNASFHLYYCPNRLNCISDLWRDLFTRWTLKSVATFMFDVFLAGLARFCESIIDYVANAESAPYPDITVDRFYGEISSAYDILFSVWIRASEAKARKS